MKKAAFLLVFISFTSLVMAASNEVLCSPGDPQKEQDKQPSFTLAKGYFSLFNIFTSGPAKSDTIRSVEINFPVGPKYPIDRNRKTSQE